MLEICQEYPSKYYPSSGTCIKWSIGVIADENVELTDLSPEKSFPIRMFKYGAGVTKHFTVYFIFISSLMRGLFRYSL